MLLLGPKPPEKPCPCQRPDSVYFIRVGPPADSNWALKTSERLHRAVSRARPGKSENERSSIRLLRFSFSHRPHLLLRRRGLTFSFAAVSRPRRRILPFRSSSPLIWSRLVSSPCPAPPSSTLLASARPSPQRKIRAITRAVGLGFLIRADQMLTILSTGQTFSRVLPVCPL